MFAVCAVASACGAMEGPSAAGDGACQDAQRERAPYAEKLRAWLEIH
jgi:hypothetical protein